MAKKMKEENTEKNCHRNKTYKKKYVYKDIYMRDTRRKSLEIVSKSMGEFSVFQALRIYVASGS